MMANEKFLEEDFYLKALAEINSDHFSEKTWLMTNFDLYKQTLNWPKGLPPIRRSNPVKGTKKKNLIQLT